MGEVERILQLVKDGKISKEDAVQLLGAISGNLKKLPAATWERLFQLMDEGMNAAALAQVLEAGDEKETKREKAYAYAFGPNFDKGKLGEMIGERVADAFRRKGMSSDARGGAKLLKIEVDSSSGDEVRVNIPIGLANFALKLIPKEAQRAMQEQGLDMNSLQEMLRGESLPEGNIIDISTSSGDEIRISIT
jgi:hypothetical protein